MDSHGRDEPGVVDLDSGNCVIDEKSAPNNVHGEGVGEQAEARFDRNGVKVRLLRRHAISVAIGGAGQRIPKLTEVLRRVARDCA